MTLHLTPMANSLNKHCPQHGYLFNFLLAAPTLIIAFSNAVLSHNKAYFIKGDMLLGNILIFGIIAVVFLLLIKFKWPKNVKILCVTILYYGLYLTTMNMDGNTFLMISSYFTLPCYATAVATSALIVLLPSIRAAMLEWKH